MKMLRRIGFKLQPCLSPISDEKDFLILLGKRALSSIKFILVVYVDNL